MDHRIIIQQGFKVLNAKQGYGQINVVNKLNMLGTKCSPSLFTNALKDSRRASAHSLKELAKGIDFILRKELDMGYNQKKQAFKELNTPDWSEEIIPESLEVPKDNIRIHDTRVPVGYKVDFFTPAKFEVLEVGARLNTFSQYFTSYPSAVYKDHIIDLLKRGVNVKAYLVDPDSNEAKLYFDDRSHIQKLEKYSLHDVKLIVQRLHEVMKEIEALKFSGKFEIFCFKHFPYANYFVVDGLKPNGKLLASQYLYGVKRAECPVWEIHRSEDSKIFRKYWESVQQFIEGAIPIAKKIEQWSV